MFKASIENKGDSMSYATTRHSSFVLDTKGKGANPVDTLLASLCGCVGHYVRDYLVDHQITHNGFYISADAGYTPEKTLDKIKVSIDLKAVKLNNEQEKGMFKFIENCPVHNILKQIPGVDLSLAKK